MLLSSPSFSDFLDRLSANPNVMPSPQPSPPEQPRQESQQQRQVPKDVNPFSAQQQLSDNQQQIGMAMIPEQTVDFSMLSLDSDSFNFRPQVYTAVLETPEIAIDTSVLSGKESNFVPSFSADEKVEVPCVELPPVVKDAPSPVEVEAPVAAAQPTVVVTDEELESDPIFALYHDQPAKSEALREIDTDAMSAVERRPVLESEKAPARFQLVTAASEEDRQQADQTRAAARLQRIVANLEAVSRRLDALSLDS
jgi:bZIP-type transcription factor MBZ1